MPGATAGTPQIVQRTTFTPGVFSTKGVRLKIRFNIRSKVNFVFSKKVELTSGLTLGSNLIQKSGGLTFGSNVGER